MTFTEWLVEHDRKRSSIMAKLSHLNTEQLISYFDYDKMVQVEPDFCPLYALGKKCHNTENLNCFLCACPCFEFSDEEPLELEHGIEIYSKCTIDSRFKKLFLWEEDGVDKGQCDCSECFIPHKNSFVRQFLKKGFINGK